MTTPQSKYADFRVTADAVVFCLDTHGTPRVLLIQRAKDPFKGAWCFPGGHVDRDEDLVDAAVRELTEETGLVVRARDFRQVGAYGKPGRDPRGQYVTVAYTTILRDPFPPSFDSMSDPELRRGLPAIQGADDAKAAVWVPLNSLYPETLGFDHGQILADTVWSWPETGFGGENVRDILTRAFSDSRQRIQGWPSR